MKIIQPYQNYHKVQVQGHHTRNVVADALCEVVKKKTCSAQVQTANYVEMAYSKKREINNKYAQRLA